LHAERRSTSLHAEIHEPLLGFVIRKRILGFNNFLRCESSSFGIFLRCEMGDFHGLFQHQSERQAMLGIYERVCLFADDLNFLKLLRGLRGSYFGYLSDLTDFVRSILRTDPGSFGHTLQLTIGRLLNEKLRDDQGRCHRRPCGCRGR